MEEFHKLAESTNYLLCHSYESVFVVDKRDGVRRLAGDHYGDPVFGSISPDETRFYSGGEGIQCYQLDGTLQSFFRDGTHSSPEKTWFVRTAISRAFDVVIVFFEEDSSSVWDLHLPTTRLTQRSMLDEFVTLLDMPDDEIWGVVWSDDARALFDLHHRALLPAILTRWRDWPINRQDHLAFLLGYTGTSEEAQLIHEMLGATDPGVASRAREALEEFQPSDLQAKR